MSQQNKDIYTSDLVEGMILAENIYDCEGNLLLSDGMVLRQIYIQKIREIGLDVVKIANEEYAVHSRVDDFDRIIHRDLVMKSTRDDAKKAVKNCMESVVLKSQVDLDKLYLIINQIIDEIFSSEVVTYNLSELRAVDDYIFDHSVNVCILSIITGVYMGFNKVRLVELGTGALLHDIGKILVPQDVLNKPDQLDDDELEIMKLHAVRGYEALKQTRQISDASLEAILSHHERCDGCGYPCRKTKDNIHVYAKIVSVADVFDAITADRVYCKKEDPYKAIAYIIEELDTKFDREIVKKFLKVVGFYPFGLYVVLNNGEYGIIVKCNKDKPTVKILYDAFGNSLNHYYVIDLLKNPTIAIVDIDPAKSKYGNTVEEYTV